MHSTSPVEFSLSQNITLTNEAHPVTSKVILRKLTSVPAEAKLRLSLTH